jgi:PAS domain S-box-containing protein/putative nucleotidyltransferase with HDIG domain
MSRLRAVEINRLSGFPRNEKKMNALTHILHIEDDNQDAELVQAMLDAADIDCQIARVQTGAEFNDALRKGNFDIILADYRIPGYNGVSALRLAQELCPDVPFIFVSGTMGEDAAIEGLTQGATDYVLKNRLARLAPAVRRALEGAENKRERKQAEETLRESEARFRVVANSANDGIVSTDIQGIIFYWNKTAEAIFGYTEEEILGQPLTLLMPESYKTSYQVAMKQWFGGSQENRPLSRTVVAVGRKKSGAEFPIELSVGSWETREGTFFTGIIRDITERKQHELEREAIITVSTELRQATTRAEILNVILDQLVDLFEADGAILVLPDPQTGGFIDEMGRGVVGERMIGLDIPAGQGVCNWVITNKKPYLNNQAEHDPLFYRPDLLGDSHCLASIPLIAQEQAIGALWIARRADFLERDLRLFNAIGDIAANALHRVTLHEQTEIQLHHLLALHQIDIAITTSFDLDVTLNIILGNVKNELKADAASILLLTPFTQTLEYAAGVGFRTRAIEKSRVKLGTGHAGQAALEYRTVTCPDISQTLATFVRSTLIADEKFSSHFVTPLIAKGQVKGVLEVFNHKTFEPEQEWIDYFEALATQTAIAIENASLFENLQRSNTELRLAYDATIEGWSRALDLRDKETEGHTLRVTEMTLRLAGKIGISDIEKVNFRRGALLHDIGKMGIPDTILLKPGPLTEDEWIIMRQHPTYAYEMLKSIDYFQIPAKGIERIFRIIGSHLYVRLSGFAHRFHRSLGSSKGSLPSGAASGQRSYPAPPRHWPQTRQSAPAAALISGITAGRSR